MNALRVPRVVHLTTSYPREDGDFAGRFVADLVKGLRAGGVDAEVLAPGGYRDFGLAYGGGIVHNVRRRPWLAPLLVLSMILAVRRVARRGDLVHAHWLAAGLICVLARRPFVLTLHGSGSAGRFSDLELARRRPGLVGFIVRRAKVVICVSKALAEAARRCGAADVRIVPNSVDVPPAIAPEADPPEVLFAGRLSPEKGIRELAAATQGMNLVVAGDGPLRELVPDALGFVPHEELVRLQSRAAVVVLPSHSEGLPVCLLEAMACGRAVVATSVGGIPDVVEDGVSGLLVEPGDVEGLRAALERLLSDPALRRRLGQAARTRIVDRCSVEAVAEATRDAYLLPELRRRERPGTADEAYASLGRATTSIPSLQ